MALIDKASLLMVPSTYEAGKLYNILPSGNRAPDSTDQHSGYDNTRADFSFDRGSNAAATRVNADGLIEKYRENLSLYSNTFSSWTAQSGGSVTSGQSGYDGTNDAWLLTSGSSTYSRIERTIAHTGVYTISLYAKAGTLNWLSFENSGITSDETYFDLVNGTKGTDGSNVVHSSIESLGDGWYRCSATFNGTSNIQRIYPAVGNGDLNSAEGNIYIQDFQFETGLVATDYLESTSVTGKAGVLVDLPRINYDANGENGSLILEPSRANLTVHSEYLGASDWAKTRCTIEDNSTTSPEGLINSAKMTSTDANESYIQDIFSFTGSTISWSFFAKKGDLNYCHGLVWDLSANGCRQWFNLNDGTVGGATTFGSGYSVSSATIEDYGSGWYRCTMIVSGSSGSNGCRVSLSSANTTITSAVNSYGYFYGLQAEAGSYPTSYIPNHGTSGGVTRAADSLYADNIGQTTAYTIFLDYEDLEQADSNFQDYISFQASGSNQDGLRAEGIGSDWRLYGYGISGSVTFPIAGSVSKKKKAIVVSTAGIKLFEDGALTNQDLSGMTIPALGAITTKRGTSAPYPVEIKNSFKQIAVFNEALSDAECISLTS